MFAFTVKIKVVYKGCPYDVGTIGYFGGVDCTNGIGYFEKHKSLLRKRYRLPFKNVEILGRNNDEQIY